MTLFGVSHDAFFLPRISDTPSPPLPKRRTSGDNFLSLPELPASKVVANRSGILESIQIYRKRKRQLEVTPEKQTQVERVTAIQRNVGKLRLLTPIEPHEEITVAPPTPTVSVTETTPKKSEDFVLQPVIIKLQKKLTHLARHKAKVNCHYQVNKLKQTQDTMKKPSPPKSDSLSRQVKEIRHQRLTTQMLEIPVSLERRQKQTMLSHNDYSIFQRNKIMDAQNRRRGLAIVQGPSDTREDLWNYNRFLYLNVKL